MQTHLTPGGTTIAERELEYHTRLDPHRGASALSDVILGGQDGLVNVLGVILGVAAATADTRIVLVAGLAFLAYEQVVFRGSMVDRLSITASMVADNSSSALAFNDPASAVGTLKSLGADPHIVGAAIYDEKG